jgi:hypothetical protein
MSSSALHSFRLSLVFAFVSCATSRAGLDTSPRSTAGVSSGAWLQYADVMQAGFDGQALRAVCERADSLRSGALMAVFRGHVILACGDVGRRLEAHSVRKSLCMAVPSPGAKSTWMPYLPTSLSTSGRP